MVMERLTPPLHRYARGDVVIAKSPTNQNQTVCKRIRAVEGDVDAEADDERRAALAARKAADAETEKEWAAVKAARRAAEAEAEEGGAREAPLRRPRRNAIAFWREIRSMLEETVSI